MAINKDITEPGLVDLVQVSDQSRDQATSLLRMVENAVSGAAGKLSMPPDARAEMIKEQRLLLSNIAQLRGLHRNACMSARDTKATTAESRQEVDRLHLQLQNLYYEQRHLQGEIASCESYDHKYQQLPLRPVEEFLERKPNYGNVDETQLMFARIEDEKAERETLEQQRQELLKRKQKLIAENKRRKEDLASLDNDLEKFIDAAKPIQKLFEKAP